MTGMTRACGLGFSRAPGVRTGLVPVTGGPGGNTPAASRAFPV